MKLSAPIPVLKRRAKAHARDIGISHNQALDQIARQEGFQSWSLLSARASQFSAGLFGQLVAGDFVLLGARPGQGKTLLGLRTLLDAIATGQRGYFFTLEYTSAQVLERIRQIGVNPAQVGPHFVLDTSDGISAAHIVAQTRRAPAGSCIVVDYLQLLDQRRENPPLADQITTLRDHAQTQSLIIIMISQIDRSYDLSTKTVPDISDVRLPNPIDMGLFTKACFLHEGEFVISSHSPG